MQTEEQITEEFKARLSALLAEYDAELISDLETGDALEDMISTLKTLDYNQLSLIAAHCIHIMEELGKPLE